VFRETLTKTGRPQIKKYEKGECKFKKASDDEFQAFKEKQTVRENPMQRQKRVEAIGN
jgi:hypothetical protein